MGTHSIQDALTQVKQLQQVILERRRFKGYSGPARIAGGMTGLFGAVFLSGLPSSAGTQAHLIGWGAVLAIGLLLNYTGLVCWFFQQDPDERSVNLLAPALDALPALGMGAIMTLALILQGQLQFLFGTWMGLYRLVHVSYRSSLPPANYWVGVWYMICGAVCLLWPDLRFENPWPMGLVFFIGETVGGCILYTQRHPECFHPGDDA